MSEVANARRGPAAVFFILPVAAFVALLLYKGGDPAVTLDSPNYIYFGADRPVGYPLFLAFAHAAFHSAMAAIPMQLAALCAAFGVLAWCFYNYAGSLRQGLILEALLFLNPGAMLLGKQIMSDCLATACLALFAAALLQIARRPSARAFGFMIAAACVAIILRPVNLALVPAVFIAILVFGRPARVPRAWLIILLLAAALAAQQLTPAVHFLRGDPAMPSNPAARDLLQKTLFRPWPPDARADACGGELIGKATTATDAYLAATPEDIRPYLLPALSGYLRFQVILPQLTQQYGFASFAEADPILMCYALARLRQDPGYFAHEAVDEMGKLLTYPSFVSAATHERIVNYLIAHPPVLPPAETRGDFEFAWRARSAAELGIDPKILAEPPVEAPRARPQILANGLRLFQLLAALAMLAGMILLPFTGRRRGVFEPAALLGVIGVAFFGELLITAIVEIALPRYIYALWPLLCTAFMLGFSALRAKAGRE